MGLPGGHHDRLRGVPGPPARQRRGQAAGGDRLPAFLLWTIGAAVVGSIIGRIAIEIIRPSDSHREDVRDKEIGRFGEYVSGMILGVGMVGPFILVLVEAGHFWIANAMYLVFVVQAVIGTIIKLIAYRRGF